jgi:hypothetical protein
MPSQRRMEAYFLGLPTPERDTKPAGSASRCITRRLYGMPLPNQEEASKKEGQSLRSGGCRQPERPNRERSRTARTNSFDTLPASLRQIIHNTPS